MRAQLRLRLLGVLALAAMQSVACAHEPAAVAGESALPDGGPARGGGGGGVATGGVTNAIGGAGPTGGRTGAGGTSAGAGGHAAVDGGASAGGATVGAGGSALGSCTPVGPGPTVARIHTPALFEAGADPSSDAECAIVNPERGIFEFRDMRSLGSLAGVRGRGYALVYGKVLIDDYRARDLDPALLEALTAAFDAVRRAGLKVLPRFYYADDGSAPDAPLDRVLGHIEQLTPLLRANADVIAALHPGFVGAWGEWHGSTNGLTSPESRRAIFDALLSALPEDRMTLSRRPSFKEQAYGGPVTEITRFSGTPLSRVGHLNDCFLSSADDVGTYQLPGERDYAVADSAFVPVGGETCAVYPARTACAPAMAEMALLHWDFLNTSYHPDVVDGWQSEGCFDQIRCRLGYRFVLLRHESPASVQRGEALAVALRVHNDGYGKLYNPRPVELVLDGPVRRVLPVTLDPRAWAPGVTTELCLAAVVPADVPAGAYRLGLRLPDARPTLRDDPAYAIRLSSGATWDDATGTNALDANVTVLP